MSKDDIIRKQRDEILKLENVIGTMKNEIEYALYSNKSEDVKSYYLKNAMRYASETIYIK